MVLQPLLNFKLISVVLVLSSNTVNVRTDSRVLAPGECRQRHSKVGLSKNLMLADKSVKWPVGGEGRPMRKYAPTINDERIFSALDPHTEGDGRNALTVLDGPAKDCSGY